MKTIYAEARQLKSSEVESVLRERRQLRKRVENLERQARKVVCCFQGVAQPCPIHEKQ